MRLFESKLRRRKVKAGRTSKQVKSSKKLDQVYHPAHDEDPKADKKNNNFTKDKKKKPQPMVNVKIELQKDSDIAGCKEETQEIQETPELLTPVKKIEQEANLILCKEEHSFSSPESERKNNSEDAQTFNENDKRLISPECTQKKMKWRKLDQLTDCDQLSDIVKSELSDRSTLIDEEPIDMFHDFDTVIYFEDSKISDNILLSSLDINNAEQDKLKQTNVENNIDVSKDPLFIPKSDNNSEVDNDKESEEETNSNNNRGKVQVRLRRSDKYNMRTIVNEKAKEPSKTQLINEIQDDLLEQKRKKLYKLKVKLVHTVPPQHKIEQSGYTLPTQDQKKMFVRYGPLKKGNFTPLEDAQIKENWEMFCRIHDWNPQEIEPFLYMKSGPRYYMKHAEERLKFVQFLANGLPWRMLYNVHHRFRRLYKDRKNPRGRYSAEEDQQILELTKKYRRKKNVYAILAKILGRSRSSVWIRHHTLTKMEQKLQTPAQKVTWTKPLIAEFVKHLWEITLCEDLTELKDATLPKPIWRKLEKKLNIKSVILEKFWHHQLHMQLFCARPIYLNDIKIQLIEIIYSIYSKSPRDIIWPNVTRYFEGITSIFLCKLFSHLVREVNVKTGITEFSCVLEYLHKEKIPELVDGKIDKFLPRLTYSNGRIDTLDEDFNDCTTTDYESARI